MIFQDPHASLKPAWRVGDIIAEPIQVFGLRQGKDAIDARVAELLAPSAFPRTMPGGFRMSFPEGSGSASRLPELLRASRNSSSATNRPRPSMSRFRRKILNLMRRLQDELGLTYLFISHNLAVVRQYADRSQSCISAGLSREAETEALFANPQHPYTRLLLQTIPDVAAPTETVR